MLMVTLIILSFFDWEYFDNLFVLFKLNLSMKSEK